MYVFLRNIAIYYVVVNAVLCLEEVKTEELKTDGPVYEVNFEDVHYGGGTKRIKVQRKAGQTFVDAALQYGHNQFGTKDVPQLIRLLKSEETLNEEQVNVMAEKDDFLATQIILGNATAQRLAIRISIARGIPLNGFQTLADKLNEHAMSLRRKAFNDCLEEATTTQCYKNNPLLQCASLQALKLGYKLLYDKQSRPYMSPLEAKMVERYLKPHFTMIEYGSGGSTRHFSKLVAEYHSVEHSKMWCDVVKCAIGPFQMYAQHKNIFYGRNNVRLQCVSIGEDETDKCSYTNQLCAQYIDAGPISLLNENEKMEINNTFHKDAYHPGYDAVLIDGKGRAAVALRILPWLHANSVVFFHDFFSLKPSGCRTCPDISAWHHILDFYDVIDSIVEGQTLAVLRPKRTMIGMSWNTLNERTHGKANIALMKSKL